MAAQVGLNYLEGLVVAVAVRGLLEIMQPPQTAATAATVCPHLLLEPQSQEQVVAVVALRMIVVAVACKTPVLEAVVAEALGVMEHQTVAAQTQLRAQQTRAVAVVAVDIRE
jgi:hypothetical protein